MAGFDWSQYAVGGAQRPDSFSGMDPQFSSALAQLFSSAPEEIRANLRVGSGYRSPDRQAELWQGALQKYGSPEAARKWVAPPGKSQHNHGHAADLKYMNDAAREWVQKNASQYGLAFPLANENWHVELAGARGGQPGVAPTMANAQAKTFDPIGEVMGFKSAPGAMPPAGPFASPMGAPAAGGDPKQMLGNLALLFAEQQQTRQKEDAAEDEVAQLRRQALFSPDSLAGLFGA